MHRLLAPGACLATLFFHAICQSLPAADLDPVMVGHWPGYTRGAARGVTVSDNYAYVVAGSLQVIDISNPTHPQRAGVYDAGAYVSDAAVSGHYAYVSGSWLEGPVSKWGLRVIDVSDPAKPRAVGKYSHGTDTAEGVSVSGNYAYVTGVCWEGGVGFYSLQVIDISTPTEPKRVGLCRTAGGYAATQVSVSGHHAYLASGEGGLQIIDISNPANPQLLASWSGGGHAYWVAVSGNHAFVAESALSHGTNDVRGGGLQIISVSDPADPRWVGACNRGEFAWCVAVSGDRAYVAASYDGLKVIDISDPANPHQIGSCDTQEARAVAISGNYAYVADEGAGLHVIVVSDPTDPERVGDYRTYQSAGGVAVSGNRAYVAEQHSYGADVQERVQVLDVSNPASPQWVRTYDNTNGSEFEWPDSTNTTVSGHYTCAVESWWTSETGDQTRLVVIDLSDPIHPQLVGSVPIHAAATVTVSGRYAFVADRMKGAGLHSLHVVDIADPAHPRLAGRYPIVVNDVAVSGNYAYVANGQDGLKVLDISRPATPQRLGGYTVNGEIAGLAVSSDYAYVVEAGWSEGTNDHSGGLRVLDVSTPASVRRVGAVDTPGLATGLAVSGNYAFVAADDLQVFDISSPVSPRQVGRYDAVYWLSAVAVRENRAYTVARWQNDETYSLQVLDLSAPLRPRPIGMCPLGFELNWRGSHMMIGGDYAYVTGETFTGLEVTDRLQVIDISNPANPQAVGNYDYDAPYDYCHGLALSGQYACLAAGNAGLLMLDLADPAHPRLVGSYMNHCAEGVVVFGNYAYVAVSPRRDGWGTPTRNPGDGSGFGVEVIDISDPARPRRVGGNSAAGYVLNMSNMVAVGGRIYFTGGQDLAILNLCQPPRLESLRLDAQGFHLLLRGVTGQMLRLERSRDLRTWDPFATVPIPASGQTLVDPTATTEPFLFYRAVSVR